ncbi:hypothetical protein AGMMS50229_06510 [Campylobacterota bacterium]|nr:hypothetical protein AGMMS50229_06510 [Campylobacterota bacterium]
MRRRWFVPFLLTVIALSFAACELQDPLGRGEMEAQNSAAAGFAKIVSVFPRTPMITVGGSVTLTALVTDGAGTVLESTLFEPVTIAWSSSNPSIISVAENGVLVGKKRGAATITAVATRGGNRSAPYTLKATVTSENALDVAELFFSPMQAYVDLESDRVFRLSAVDYAGTATSLSDKRGRVTITSSNSNVVITPETIDLTATGNAVEVTVRGAQKGFSFIDALYEFDSNQSNELITISATPLVVQVKDSVETSLPNTASFEGGHYLSIAVGEFAGYKTIYTTHLDRPDANSEGLVLSNFYTAWQHQTISGGLGTAIKSGQATRIVLSPFTRTLSLPIALTLRDNYLTLLYMINPDQNSRYLETRLSSDAIQNTEIPEKKFGDGDRVMDISAWRSADGMSSALHIAYFDANASNICLISMSDQDTIATDAYRKKLCLETNQSVSSVSVAHNNSYGEPRFVYAVRATEIERENNTTDKYPEALYYVARQSGLLYSEKITNIDGNIADVTLRLDRNNKPMVALREGNNVRVYSRERSISGGFKWGTDPLNVINTEQGDIASVAFDVDAYNEPRIAFASTGGGTTAKIRYARKPPFRNFGSRWVIEELDAKDTAEQGSSSAIAVDSANRAHLVYTAFKSNKSWFNYWAEPNFFDYRNFPIVEYHGADLIMSLGGTP